MRKTLILLALLAIGCGGQPRSTLPPATPQAAAPTPTSAPTVQARSGDACPITKPTQVPPTDTDVFGDGPGAEWYCSPDNELCAVKNGPWSAGGWKIGWRKPRGASLQVTGRRLDATAPPLRASIPDGYFGTFQSSGLTFPSAGCWQVEARAAASTLRFVVTVAPARQSPAGGSCDDLADVADHPPLWTGKSLVNVRRSGCTQSPPHRPRRRFFRDSGGVPGLRHWLALAVA